MTLGMRCTKPRSILVIRESQQSSDLASLELRHKRGVMCAIHEGRPLSGIALKFRLIISPAYTSYTLCYFLYAILRIIVFFIRYQGKHDSQKFFYNSNYRFHAEHSPGNALLVIFMQNTVSSNNVYSGIVQHLPENGSAAFGYMPGTSMFSGTDLKKIQARKFYKSFFLFI